MGNFLYFENIADGTPNRRALSCWLQARVLYKTNTARIIIMHTCNMGSSLYLENIAKSTPDKLNLRILLVASPNAVKNKHLCTNATWATLWIPIINPFLQQVCLFSDSFLISVLGKAQNRFWVGPWVIALRFETFSNTCSGLHSQDFCSYYHFLTHLMQYCQFQISR